jgi:hypothetical protein
MRKNNCYTTTREKGSVDKNTQAIGIRRSEEGDSGEAYLQK